MANERFMQHHYGASGYVAKTKRVGLESVEVEGIWLRRMGDYVEVLVERDRQWIPVIREHFGGPFSHIVEPEGIVNSNLLGREVAVALTSEKDLTVAATLHGLTHRDPTEQELNDPIFNAIWNVIKKWDICRDQSGLYAEATGTDVCTILDAIEAAKLTSEKET